MLKFLRIERPTSATRRSSAAAASITCCTRWTLEAKQVTMIRPSQRENCSSSAGPTVASEGTTPGRSALVESPQRQSTPSDPSSASRAMSAGRPSTGVWSKLVVAGDQDRAEVGVQGDRAGVGDRVRHVDHLDLERARPRPARRARAPSAAPRAACAPRASSAPGRSSAGRCRSPAASRSRGARRAALRRGPRAPWVSTIASISSARLAQVVEVRQHEVDSEHLRCREHQPGVDDDDPPVALEHGHVLADLPQPAEGQDANRVAHARFPAPLASRPCSRRAPGGSPRARPPTRAPSAAARARRPPRAARAPPSPRPGSALTDIAP